MTNTPSPTGGQVPLRSPWLAALLILGGCFFGDTVPMGVRNLTSEPVEVYYVGADEGLVVGAGSGPVRIKRPSAGVWRLAHLLRPICSR